MTKKKYIAWMVLGIGVLWLSWYGLGHWFVVSDFQIEFKKEPEWEGSAEEIKTLLQIKLKKFIGQKMWQVSFKDLKATIRSESRVGEVRILRRLPNRFFIQVHPRKPLLVWLNIKEGAIHPLSMEGQILPPLPRSRVPDLPILRGEVFFKDKAIREQAIAFMNILPEQGEFSRQAISEIKYSVPEKSLIFILSTNGKPVKMGLKALSLKIKRVDSVFKIPPSKKN